MFRQNKKVGLYLIIIALILSFSYLPLPYYIYSPGTAEALDKVVSVADSTESEGDLHLVTVRGGQATPLTFMLASFSDYQDIHHMDELFPEGYDRDSYMQTQLKMMENSQDAAVVVAYQAAGESVDITYEGVCVDSVVEGI